MVYFLYCIRPVGDRENRVYMGYTTNPNRSLARHNGEIGGGSRHTSSHRPWSWVVIVAGSIDLPRTLNLLNLWRNQSRNRLGDAYGLRTLVNLIHFARETNQGVLTPFFYDHAPLAYFGNTAREEGIVMVLVITRF